jgi:DnaJ like chaperone protein
VERDQSHWIDRPPALQAGWPLARGACQRWPGCRRRIAELAVISIALAVVAPSNQTDPRGEIMAPNTSGGFNSLLRDARLGLQSLFGGGKPDDQRRITLEVLFGLLGYLAKLDSLITSHEAEFINKMMDELKLSAREREVAADALQRGRDRQIDLVTELQRFRSLHKPGSAEADHLYDALLQLAAADERLRPKERQFLETVTVELGFTLEELEDRLNRLATG